MGHLSLGLSPIGLGIGGFIGYLQWWASFYPGHDLAESNLLMIVSTADQWRPIHPIPLLRTGNALRGQ